LKYLIKWDGLYGKNKICGYLQATVEMALKRDPFMNYLSDLYKSKICNHLSDESYDEAAADKLDTHK
jgi:hypothetical protein